MSNNDLSSYGEALREERDADRQGTVPQVPQTQPPRSASVGERLDADVGPDDGSGLIVEDDSAQADGNPFKLPPETIALGKRRVTELLDELQQRRNNPTQGS